MISQPEAEALAQRHMQDYVASCDCKTREDVANVLMKLASLCGVGMAATVGRDEAVARLLGTAEFIRESQQAAPRQMERAN